MKDTKGNEIKQQSFAEKLKQTKNQDLQERELADSMLAQLKKDVELNWEECFEKLIQDACISIKNDIEQKVAAGNVKKYRDKNKVCVRYNFKDRVSIPDDFYYKTKNTINEIERLSKEGISKILAEIPQLTTHEYSDYRYMYIMCNSEPSGFLFVGLNDNCIRFTEELEKRLLQDGIKLEGIAVWDRKLFTPIKGKTLRFLADYKFNLQFSMEF